MSNYKMMVLVFCISGCLPTMSYADEKVDFYAQFLFSFAQSPETIRNNIPARSEMFFRRHGVKNIQELRAGFNQQQLTELAQQLAGEYQRVFRNPKSLIRSRALGILYQSVNDIDPRIASRLPQPHRRQSSDNGPQNAIEDNIKVNQQTRAVAQAAINQGYILGETKGPLRMPQISRPRNPTPGSFADRFRDRMPDQLGNDLGKQTGELLDLDSLRPASTMNQASRSAINQNQDPGAGFEFNEGGFITPDANFEPDPPGSKTEMAQVDQSANPNAGKLSESNQIKGKYDDPELNQAYEDFQKLKNSKASNEEQYAAQSKTPMVRDPEIPFKQLNEPEPDLESDLLVERPEYVKPPPEPDTENGFVEGVGSESLKTMTKTDIPINAYEVYYGTDLFTGEPLSFVERVGRGVEVAVDVAVNVAPLVFRSAAARYSSAAAGALAGSIGGPVAAVAGAVVGAVAGEAIIKHGKKAVYKWLNH
ncbi:hypothetical protein V6x_20400 [Gimesia chilikensis]|uniref:Glycine zipper domain-containing protein n=1 Tax=Gimesia chilikensis TaxID=2605989 RepID=A0A517WAS0_9PLAN|nr:hypothetical protein [Gimesia chilikensis]QDU02338.1 hypothetical protein V6x_20400 [Gimesia chilikensis]